MDINYIKSNFSKLGPDHLYRFLIDIITRDSLDNIEDYDVNKIYQKGAKVYIFENGVHHIYECIVEYSTEGAFMQYEWLDIIDVFKGMEIDYILNKLFIIEELFEADEETNIVPIQFEDFDINLCKVILYHSIQGRLSEKEFAIVDNHIELFDLIINPGEYIIMDIYEYDKKDKINGEVYINFTDMNGIDIKPRVRYLGEIGTACDIYPAIIDGYEFIETVGEINCTFDIEPINIIFKYRLK